MRYASCSVLAVLILGGATHATAQRPTPWIPTLPVVLRIVTSPDFGAPCEMPDGQSGYWEKADLYAPEDLDSSSRPLRRPSGNFYACHLIQDELKIGGEVVWRRVKNFVAIKFKGEVFEGETESWMTFLPDGTMSLSVEGEVSPFHRIVGGGTAVFGHGHWVPDITFILG